MTSASTSVSRRERVPTRLRKQVWDRAQNPTSSEGHCVVCRAYIHILAFECAHIVAVADGGKTTIANLLPCCSMCNRSMGKMNLYDYVKKYHPQNLKYCIDYSGESAQNSGSSSSPTLKSASTSSRSKTKTQSSSSSSKKDDGVFETISSIATSVIGLFSEKKPSTTSLATSLATSSTTSSKTTSVSCAHILERGENKGKYCSVKAVSGKRYCSRHAK